ncbi:hypothetical protein VTJ49DRAFT_7411 [Mycothermus thermophilus]|uniref:Acyltransferase 3 domain-containing protein n=1 Tax=Humicola insolens TaxID=85995 RepID=A0ABR3VGV0_HUMIN
MFLASWPSRRYLRPLRPLLPSFIADAVFPISSTSSHRQTPHRSTAYLDGLRGIAAIIVFIHHYTDAFPSLNLPYTLLDPPPHQNQTNPTAPAHPYPPAGVVLPTRVIANTTTTSPINTQNPGPTVLQLPFFRLLHSGRPMVHIFFVISGFALSYKPLRYLHREHNRHVALDSLASTTFRRAPRLLGPPIVSTFLCAWLQQAGLLPTPNGSVLAEMGAWWTTVWREITWPWAWDRDLAPGYDVHLWSIPVELAHSMMLFVVLLALVRVRYVVRRVVVCGGMGYCLACGRWAGFEFLAGMGIAEGFARREVGEEKKMVAKEEEEGGLEDLEGWREVDRDNGSEVGLMNGAGGVEGKSVFGWKSVRMIRMLRRCGKRAVQIAVLIAGLFIAGWPKTEAARTPGIRTLLFWTPEPFASEMDDEQAPQKFWFALAAAGVVWAVGELAWLRRVFETSVARYCGDISFAVYFCHGPVSNLFGPAIMGYPATAEGEQGRGVRGVVGMDTPGRTVAAWFIGLFLLGPLVIWVADVFWRAVDRPTVNLARRLETWCLEEERRTRPVPESQGYSVIA